MTAPDEAFVAGVIEKLTPSMKNALRYGLRGYYDPNTIKALRRRGLVEGACLTETGLAVREQLLRMESGS